MQVHTLHRWDLPPTQAVTLQKELAASLRADPFDLTKARLIAGVDVSGSKFDPLLTAGAVVWDRETGAVVETVWAQAPEGFPYIPGLLSFREIPVLAQALATLGTKPDAILVDGQGQAHPRRLGIAAHLGLLVDVPTVGVGKSRLTGKIIDPGPIPGDHAPLIDGTARIGEILRTKIRSNPLYISAGNRIELDDAVRLVQACLRGYRLPEPTRLAHLHVNLARTTGHGMPASAGQRTLL